MVSLSYPPFAYFYPMDSVIPVEICGAPFKATHDSGAVCYENRHFLDVHLWQELKEGQFRQGESVEETKKPQKKDTKEQQKRFCR